MLNITQYSLDKDNKKYEGAVGFSGRDGVVTLSEADGKLMINIYTNQTDIEAISHELFIHNAGEIDNIIQGYKENGLKGAENAQKLNADDDHRALKNLDSNHNGVKMYKQLAKELQQIKPEYKAKFEQIEKTNNTRYE